MSELQKLREVLVYNQPRQKHYIFKTATDKWTELADLISQCPELEVDDINKMRAVVSSTQNTLELPNALIPEGPQKIFLFEAKVKSGLDYATMGYNDLRRLVRDKGINNVLGSNPAKSALIELLEKNAGITKKKESRTTRTGKVKEVITKVESASTKEIMKGDKEILDHKPSNEERLASLEAGFAALVDGLFSVCSNFVKSVEVKKEPVKEVSTKVEIEDLEREARMLKI